MKENLEKIAKLDHFIEKENLNSLVVCIVLVIAMTQIFKSLFPEISPRIMVLIFSAITSYCRMLLNNHLTKNNIFERILMATINIIPIAFGSIGSYETVLHNVLKNMVIKL